MLGQKALQKIDGFGKTGRLSTAEHDAYLSLVCLDSITYLSQPILAFVFKEDLHRKNYC